MKGAALSYCGDQVRRFDHDRFLCALLAPTEAREAFFALAAFNLEVARIREVVHEPLLGEMRLTWWRQTIEEIYAGHTPPQPVAAALARAVVRHRLGREPFLRLLDGRSQDFADVAPADLARLTEYAEATAGSLVRLTIHALGIADGAADAAAREVGIAWALTGLLRAVPFHARGRRVYLPADLNRRAGLDVGALFEKGSVPGVAVVVEEVASAAGQHLAAARALRREVPGGATAALLPAVFADIHLARLHRCRYNPFDPRVQRRSGTALLRLTAAAAVNRY